VRTLAIVASALLLAAGCGGDDAPEDQPFPPTGPDAAETNGFETDDEVEVELRERDDSGQSGTAVLTAFEGGTRILVTLEGAEGLHPVRLREGTCDEPAGGESYALNVVAGGGSQTGVPVPLGSLVAGSWALEILGAEDDDAVACGEVVHPRS
jgi:hypothetical protein